MDEGDISNKKQYKILTF